MINQNFLWGPGLDDELTKLASKYILALTNMHGIALEGAKCNLSEYSPMAKLYILAHGHSRMPLFCSKLGSWTANQLADLLVEARLNKTHRDIELLVCHAGESVNTQKAGAKLMNLDDQVKQAKAAGQSGKVAGIVTKYEAAAKKGQQPTFFETDPEQLLLPLAAQFCQALKHRGFTNFRIISYKCPVAQYAPDAHVYLNLEPKGGPWGVNSDDPRYLKYRVTWR